jgi:phenylalanyl-tRNA synthetase beta chain
LSGKEICKLLQQANYDAELEGKKIELSYPAYRQDIMHPRDIVEDVIISYGYNKIEPVVPKLKTESGIAEGEVFSNKVSGIMTSLGFQEILSYTLTNKDNIFSKMNLKENEVVEIENPVSLNWNVFRNWLLPSLMEFYSNNQHVRYPQNIFEVGDAVLIDEEQETKTSDVRKLAVGIANSKVGYSDIAGILDALMKKLKVKYKLGKTKHDSFIEGRIAEIIVKGKPIGIIGEVHPAVLKNWKVEMPIAGFEIELKV